MSARRLSLVAIVTDRQQTAIQASEQPIRVSKKDLLEQAVLTIQIKWLTGSYLREDCHW